jgi:hypothetical protein
MKSAWRIAAILLIVTSAMIGCEPAAPAPAGGASGALRIVSLSPAISRTLADLKLADAVVGRSP